MSNERNHLSKVWKFGNTWRGDCDHQVHQELDCSLTVYQRTDVCDGTFEAGWENPRVDSRRLKKIGIEVSNTRNSIWVYFLVLQLLRCLSFAALLKALLTFGRGFSCFHWRGIPRRILRNSNSERDHVKLDTGFYLYFTNEDPSLADSMEKVHPWVCGESSIRRLRADEIFW